MAKKSIEVEALKHKQAKRRNIPTAEFESVMDEKEKMPLRIAYERRHRDLDPQLVWRGKDEQDWSDLVVPVPPLYIQEKVHPKVLIDDLMRQTKERAKERAPDMPDLFADFNGLPDEEAKTEFYQHDANWSNRLILGDSLQVMASLAEREGLRGQVQCIYIDPPYGIKFNSNFQWSTTSRDVKDGNKDHVTREPEQVKAFRDTWRDGIHSYLTYLRDRLTVARELLSESGSIFVQIGDENAHRVRAVMDEVFGDDNFVASIEFTKSSTGLQASTRVASITDTLIWYSRNSGSGKFRRLLEFKGEGFDPQYSAVLLPDGSFRALTQIEKETFPRGVELENVIQPDNLTKPGPGAKYAVKYRDRTFEPGNRWWGTTEQSMTRLLKAGRVVISGSTLRYARKFVDTRYGQLSNLWTGFLGQTNPTYVVQTNSEIVQRCILLTTDPGDLVLDPTCGSGTTAYIAEQWGRRWITIDTSRVALALARARIMGARYPYYLLADSREGQIKEAEVTRTAPKETPTRGDLRLGFVYERVRHITLKSIANNAEVDVIWEKWQVQLEPLRAKLNAAVVKSLEEWEIPSEPDPKWPTATKTLHKEWWDCRIKRQREIDASIAAKAEFEYLFDKPYLDSGRIRVAGPFTVESLSPHRVLAVDADDELVDLLEATEGKRAAPERSIEEPDFAEVILETLKAAGVQQAHKDAKINFTSVVGWPGNFICGEGRYLEGGRERRAGIFVGPEFGTVAKPDLVAAAREAGDAGFDVLIACAFNYDAHSAEFEKLGRIPVLKARMNADLHMAEELKSTGSGNLFVIFGEPDINIEDAPGGMVQVRLRGVDVFHPQTGEIASAGPDEIALWLLDTDYNEEAFFVRHAYFLGANDPYKALKTTLKAEIDEEAWASLHREVSRPFAKPQSGRIAIKVINHLGDEVMKVLKLG